MAQDPDLQERLDTFSGSKRKPGRSAFSITALAFALGLGGAGVAYFLATDWRGDEDGLKTSEVEPFQNDRIRTGGRLEFPAEETDQRINEALIAVEEALDVPEKIPATTTPDAEVLAELERLRAALADSQVERNAEIQSAVTELRNAFKDQTQALKASVDERDQRIANLERESKTRLTRIIHQSSDFKVAVVA